MHPVLLNRRWPPPQPPLLAHLPRDVVEQPASDIEASVRGDPPDVRLRVRQTQSAPSFDELRTWLEKTQSRISGKTVLVGGNPLPPVASGGPDADAARRPRLHRQQRRQVLQRVAEHPVRRLHELLPRPGVDRVGASRRHCLLVVGLPASDTAASPHAQADDEKVGGIRDRA